MAQAITVDVVQGQQVATDGQHKASATLASLSNADTALLESCCTVQAAACCQLATQQQSQQNVGREDESRGHFQLLQTALSQLRSVLAAAKHGKLTGAAALSLGSVLHSALILQPAPTEPQPESAVSVPDSQYSAQQEDVASQLRIGLLEMAAAADQVVKLPGAAVGRQGVALGLSAVLGAELGGHGKSGSSGLISRPGWSAEAQGALQARLTNLAMRQLSLTIVAMLAPVTSSCDIEIQPKQSVMSKCRDAYVSIVTCLRGAHHHLHLAFL